MGGTSKSTFPESHRNPKAPEVDLWAKGNSWYDIWATTPSRDSRWAILATQSALMKLGRVNSHVPESPGGFGEIRYIFCAPGSGRADKWQDWLTYPHVFQESSARAEIEIHSTTIVSGAGEWGAANLKKDSLAPDSIWVGMGGIS